MNKMNKNDRKKKNRLPFQKLKKSAIVSTHSPRVEPLWLVHLSRQFLAVQSLAQQSPGTAKLLKPKI